RCDLLKLVGRKQLWPMSVRVDTLENDISLIVSRLSRPAWWRKIGPVRWWERRRARQDLAVRKATELLNQFGKDSYWFACVCARRSPGALGRHWHAVAVEIERRTSRKSPATWKTAFSPRAAHHTAHEQHFAARSAALPTDEALHADAPDDLHDGKT